MVVEFRVAARHNVCEFYGRVGSPTAPEFSLIPGAAFFRCRVRRWGSTFGGGGEIMLEDGTPVYEVYVAPVTVPSPSARRGRRPKVDWDGTVKRFVFEFLDFHGGLHPGDPQCHCAADVVRAVTEFVENKLGATASESTLKFHTRKFLAEWLATRVRN
jgi:hypothetical protein